MKIRSLLRTEPYWVVIGLFWLLMGGIYIYHLSTGWMPDRVAINLTFLGDFPVYWYGVVIMSGVALGAYVASELAYKRSVRLFEQTVPAKIRGRDLSALALPKEIEAVLAKNKITTLGELLLRWGFNPAAVGLNRIGIKIVKERLNAAADLNPLWLSDDPPWRKWNPDYVWGGIGVCLVLGVIGARLYHVLTPSPSMAVVGITSPLDYFQRPQELLNIRNGGLGIYGGILGGLLGLIWYTRRHRLSTLAWADLAAIGLALGQMMGRWGNFFNQELYGSPTNLPWAVRISPPNRLPAYADIEQFQPAFLYESLWSLMTFMVLHHLAKRYQDKLQPGEITALYLIFYAVGRTLLELIRLDSRTVIVGGIDLHLPVATLVSLMIALLMGLWLFIRRRKAAKVTG